MSIWSSCGLVNAKPSAISLQELRHPPHHLRDLLADVDAGQHGRHALAQIDRRRRLGDHVVAGHVNPAGLIHPHVGVGGQPPADVPVGEVVEGLVPVGDLADLLPQPGFRQVAQRRRRGALGAEHAAVDGDQRGLLLVGQALFGADGRLHRRC